MARESRRWTLADLIDFEREIASSPVDSTPATRTAVTAAASGLQGAAARRAGLRVWLDQAAGKSRSGRKFLSALSVVSAGLGLLAFIAGISAALGFLDGARRGIHVTAFLAILIGGQWLLLVLAAAAWALRHRAAGGFSAVQEAAGKIALKLAGESGGAAWWRGLLDGGSAPRAAILWRLARVSQVAGICFNLGIIGGLAGLVLVKHVGFYWETTTETAMRAALDQAVAVLSAPWAVFGDDALPRGEIIDATRWDPGKAGTLPPGPAEWWRFLLLTTLVWGLLPRVLLWSLAWSAGRRALARLDFQGRAHRALWRDLTGTARGMADERPLDGVLVLDVGGTGLAENSLRPFLLRHLRVNPVAWHPVGVLDPNAESQVQSAFSKAPAGVVLLAEGWSLSPPRMAALHARARDTAGAAAPVKFLVANADSTRRPLPPTPEERLEWTKFVDSLRDPSAEVFFYEEEAVATLEGT